MADDEIPPCPGCSSPLCEDCRGPLRGQGQNCEMQDCTAPISARGLCSKHLTRLRRHGDPAVVLRGALRKDWSGDAVSYRAMHKRVETERGPAAQHHCIDCSAPAQQWAVRHDQADAERSQGGYSMPISVDVQAYDPMCRSCHRKRDIAARASAGDPVRAARFAGTDNGNSRLTAEQVLELRAIPARSASVSELSRRYGVSRRTIDRILRGLSYVDLLPEPGR